MLGDVLIVTILAQIQDAIHQHRLDSPLTDPVHVKISLEVSDAKVASVDRFVPQLRRHLIRALNERRKLPKMLPSANGISGMIVLEDPSKPVEESTTDTVSGAHTETLTGADTSGTVSPSHLKTEFAPIVGSYLHEAENRERRVYDLLSEYQDEIRTTLSKLLVKPRPSFRADENGYRSSFEFIDRIQQDVMLCGGLLFREERPIFLRRLLSPHRSGNNLVQFAVHDFQTGDSVEDAVSRVPHVQPEFGPPVQSIDGIGRLELIRQQRIEAFRRRLSDLVGETVRDKERIKELKASINNERMALNLSFAYAEGDAELRKVALRVSYTSFQLRSTLPDKQMLYGSTAFPDLFLLDNQNEN